MMTGKAKPRVLFYFLHLLGVGHVYRAKRLIEGFYDAGIAVDVIYGGTPVPGINFMAENTFYLPAIKAGDNAYSFYLDENGERLGTAYQDMRQKKLLDIFATLSPDLILTEAFPFGRRMVRQELAALLEAAAARPQPPIIVSSVRDILQERKKSGRNEEVRDWIVNRFDHVLVHSDPKIIALDSTFPLANEIQNKLSYTGFVIPPSAPECHAESFDVIVSAGGGAFGGPLMTTALGAAELNKDRCWCLITGPNLPNDKAELLRANAPPHVTVKTQVENLSAYMRKAKISVSQCGYNTAMDALAAHQDSACRAVFIPYDTQGQTEQLRRSELLENTGYGVSVPQSRLTSESLLDAIEAAQKLPKVDQPIDFDGVKSSARLVQQWIAQRK